MNLKTVGADRRGANLSAILWRVVVVAGWVTSILAVALVVAIIAKQGEDARDAKEVHRAQVGDVIEDSRGVRGLEILAMADQLPSPHARQLWYMAANMAFNDYRLDGDEPIEVDAVTINAATW